MATNLGLSTGSYMNQLLYLVDNSANNEAMAKTLVQELEKHALECPKEEKFAAFEVIDTILRMSRNKYGVHDMYSPIFAPILMRLTKEVFLTCSVDNRAKFVKILQGWEGIFVPSILQPLLEFTNSVIQRDRPVHNQPLHYQPYDHVNAKTQQTNHYNNRMIPSAPLPSFQQPGASPFNTGSNIMSAPWDRTQIHHFLGKVTAPLHAIPCRYQPPPPPYQMPASSVPYSYPRGAMNLPPPYRQPICNEPMLSPHTFRFELAPQGQSGIHNNYDNLSYLNVPTPTAASFPAESFRFVPSVRYANGKDAYQMEPPARTQHQAQPQPKLQPPVIIHRPLYYDISEATQRNLIGIPESRPGYITLCSSTLMVSQLPESATKKNLDDIFSNFGIINSITFDWCNKCAFVSMRRRENAKQAFDRLQANKRLYKHFGNQVQLSWAPGIELKKLPDLQAFWKPELTSAFVPYSLIRDKDHLETLGQGFIVDRPTVPAFIGTF